MRTFFLLIFISISLNSQNLNDVVNWSLENESGNSRYISMSGAFGALGGNLSAISSNPASGAVFELSRIGASIVVNDNSIKSEYKGSNNILKSSDSNYQTGLVLSLIHI